MLLPSCKGAHKNVATCTIHFSSHTHMFVANPPFLKLINIVIDTHRKCHSLRSYINSIKLMYMCARSPLTCILYMRGPAHVLWIAGAQFPTYRVVWRGHVKKCAYKKYLINVVIEMKIKKNTKIPASPVLIRRVFRVFQ
jgi:hypothetical protein